MLRHSIGRDPLLFHFRHEPSAPRMIIAQIHLTVQISRRYDPYRTIEEP
jgi:hypothetical protein